MAVLATLTTLTTLALFASSLADAAKVEPVAGPSNPQTSDCPSGSVGWKYEPVLGGTGKGDGTLSVDVTVFDSDVGETFNFVASRPIVTVFVKGGTVSNRYVYDPGVTSDEGLHSPVNSNNGKYFGLSHVVFCYTAPPPTGELTVVKSVVNKAGDAQPSDWTMHVAGPTASSFPGAGGAGVTQTVDAGTYVVTESGGPTGYTLAYSGDCDANGNVTVPAFHSRTCILTNTQNDQPPPPRKATIIVEKQIIPAGYRPPQGGFVFSGAINAVLGDGESASREVDPGTYTVTESLHGRPFWDLVSIACTDEHSSGDVETLTATFEVAAGETVKCTFENQKRGRIVVKKVTSPAGLVGTFDFTASYDADGFSLSHGQLNTSQPLSPGSYSVSEDTPDGWVLEAAFCDEGQKPGSIELAAATTVFCTFVNAPEPRHPGSITVRKLTMPVGDSQEFDFHFGDTDFSLSDGQSETFGDLDAGDYSVSEDTPVGWDLTSATCDNGDDPDDIDLGEGENVICTLINTKRGAIVVEKQTNPNGAQGSFTFVGDAAGSIGDGGQIVVSNVVPGTYEVTEAETAGWLLTSIECDNEGSSGDVGERTATYEVGPGETVTCVFGNAQHTTGRGSIDVQKSASPTTLKEPGGQVSYSVRITNTSNVNVTVSNVVDDKFGDLDDSGGSGCFDVPINLEPGAFASCQFTKQISGQAGTEHVNVVCADATDQSGSPLRDCDDARVTITPRLIDLVIVKEATTPTKLNGTVHYSLTVTNKGPDTATNVVVADPAPAGIQYQAATPSQGACSVSPALVTCQLGTLAPGQTVTIAVTGKATAVGRHVNTATVTGDGGRETDPSDNTDSAETVVPAPATPPVKPKPPAVETCTYLVVTPKMVKADGKKDRIVAKVRSATKPMKGVKVVVRGVGVSRSARTNAQGVAVIVVNPRKPGVITITAVDKGDPCGARRIGVVGVFLPPVTG